MHNRSLSDSTQPPHVLLRQAAVIHLRRLGFSVRLKDRERMMYWVWGGPDVCGFMYFVENTISPGGDLTIDLADPEWDKKLVQAWSKHAISVRLQ